MQSPKKSQGNKAVLEKKQTFARRNTLQRHTATHCNTLQHAPLQYFNMFTGMPPRCTTLQHTAPRCTALRHKECIFEFRVYSLPLPLPLPLPLLLPPWWCERCLLITESPKTPGHYRYLIWVLVYIPNMGLAVFSLRFLVFLCILRFRIFQVRVLNASE